MLDTRGEFEEPKKKTGGSQKSDGEGPHNSPVYRSPDLALPNFLTITSIDRATFIEIFENIGYEGARSIAGEIFDTLSNDAPPDLASLRDTYRYCSEPLSLVWVTEFCFDKGGVEQIENALEICFDNNPVESTLPYLELKKSTGRTSLTIHLYRLQELSWEAVDVLLQTILPSLPLNSLKERYSSSPDVLLEGDEELCIKVGENLALECSLVSNSGLDKDSLFDEMSVPELTYDRIKPLPVAVQLSNPTESEIALILSRVFGSEIGEKVSESGIISNMNKFIQCPSSINGRALKRIATQIGISGEIVYCQGASLTSSGVAEDGEKFRSINREVFFKFVGADSSRGTFVLRPALYSRSKFIACDAKEIDPKATTFGLEFLGKDGDSPEEFYARSWGLVTDLSKILNFWVDEGQISNSISELMQISEKDSSSEFVEYQHQGRFNISIRVT
jgi:hypothetical protein